MTPFLPPVVPFGSKQWPTLVTPGPGPASIADLAIVSAENSDFVRSEDSQIEAPVTASIEGEACGLRDASS